MRHKSARTVTKTNMKPTTQLFYINIAKVGTFCSQSSAPPVTKVSFPLSSTVTAESFSKVMPAANGWPGLLQKGS